MTLLVRDEIDIIESNIKFHLNAGVDNIIATDNGSVDGTTEVLKEYEHKGLLEYIYQPPADFSQGIWVTRMAQMAFAKYKADWIINGDADELFVSNCGNLKRPLEGIPKRIKKLYLSKFNFVPVDRPGISSPLVEMTYCRPLNLSIKGKPVNNTKVMHRGLADIRVFQGNHDISSIQIKNYKQTFIKDIVIYHYPVRSLRQFESKVRNGGSGYAINTSLPGYLGNHKRRWYKQFMKGELKEEYNKIFFDRQRLVDELAAQNIFENLTVCEQICNPGIKNSTVNQKLHDVINKFKKLRLPGI